MINRRRTEIADGIGMTIITDSKFKTNSINVHFICRHTEEEASAAAAAAYMIDDTCASYPTVTAFSRKLGALYGAGIGSGVQRCEDGRDLSVSASCIADKYALNGEEITCETAELLLSCIFDPVTENGIFPEKQFALKKQELIDDIDAEINDKRGYALKKTGRIVFRGETTGIPIKGERESAEKVTAAEAWTAYQKILRTARIEIIYVGCEMPEKCEQLLVKRFSEIQRDEYFSPTISFSPLKPEPEYATERLDVMQSKMVMAFKTNFRPEDRAISAVFSTVFGASPFSMLFKNVREKLSLCYYCSSSFYHNKGTLYVDSGIENVNIEAAKNEILNQLDLIAKGEFSDELLEQSKLLLICSSKAINDSPRALADWYFNCYIEGEVVTPEEKAARTAAVDKESICRLAAALKLDTVYVLTGKEE